MPAPVHPHRRTRPAPQRGHALIEALAGTLAIALVLGWLGPTLDDRGIADYGYTAPSIEAGEVARLEADARRRCAQAHGDNGGVILLQDGAIVCTDKHGRRLRNQTTQVVRAAP